MQLFNSVVIGVLVAVLVAYCAWRAIASARTPQGAVGWVVFLLAAPWFALPAYLVFGDHKVRRYTSARRDSRRVIEGLEAFGKAHPPERRDARLAPFEEIAEMPAVGGNGVRLLVDGAETFEAIFAGIDSARRYLLVQFYTIQDDDLGRDLADRLIAAAGRGVAVRLIFDGVGSYTLPNAYRRRLTEAGVTVLDPRKSRGPSTPFAINFRNHRKTVIVDGRRGFLGGLNVADLYMGRDPSIGAWRDTHLAVTGPMVAQLQLVFVEDWHWASGETLDAVLDWQPVDDAENRTGLIVATGPGDEMDTGALFFFSAISAARERVWIASPYFVPDVDVLTALKHAALRGCDVRILVPKGPDHYLTWLAAFAYFDEVRAAGVGIHLYAEGFMHQKVVLVDGDLAAVGTTNLDNRSFRLNFETMALFSDADFAGRVAAMLEADFARSDPLETPLPRQKLYIRVGAPLARLLAPIL